MKKYLKSTAALLMMSFLLTTGLSCTKGSTQEAESAYKPVTLKFWSVYDDTDAYAEIIKDYRATHPNVSIEYKKLRYEEYEKKLLEALALDEGPDIIAVHNTWMRKYQDYLVPMPTSVDIPVKTMEGSVQKTEVIKFFNEKLFTPDLLAKTYVDAVAEDAVLTFEKIDRVYGLPLSLDTLALYYNKDILNGAGLASPAQSWTELQAQVEKLRKIDEDNNVLLAAIPLGTGQNIVRSFDILSLLMMQLKTEMIKDGGQVNFTAMPADLAGQGLTQPPGLNALDFYTSFANPLLTSYTWNTDMPSSLDTFIAGKSAYFLGYSYHRPVIEAQSPKLNFSIAPMLQIQGYDSVNYANFWLNCVSKKSKNQNWAWDFIRFMSTKDEAIKYLDMTKKPTALRSLYNTQLENPDVAVFAEQILKAKSWYKGKDSNAAEDIFVEMIEAVNKGEALVKDAAKLAQTKIQQTMK